MTSVLVTGGNWASDKLDVARARLSVFDSGGTLHFSAASAMTVDPVIVFDVCLLEEFKPKPN
jgi:hypothetical protein